MTTREGQIQRKLDKRIRGHRVIYVCTNSHCAPTRLCRCACTLHGYAHIAYMHRHCVEHAWPSTYRTDIKQALPLHVTSPQPKRCCMPTPQSASKCVCPFTYAPQCTHPQCPECKVVMCHMGWTASRPCMGHQIHSSMQAEAAGCMGAQGMHGGTGHACKEEDACMELIGMMR